MADKDKIVALLNRRLAAHSGSPPTHILADEILAEIQAECIELLVHNDDGPDYFIGCVEVPSNTTYDEACEKLEGCWCDWREEVPHPDADSEFIPWLVEKHGWSEGKGNYHFTIGE